MTYHPLWIDTLNTAQLQGKSLSPWRSHMDALTIADYNWPFKYVNGVQTAKSESLELDKQAHKSTPFDLEQCEDAPL